MKDEIINLKNQAIGRISDATTPEELEEIRIDFLGRNGEISKFFKEMGKLSVDEKKQVGFVINEAKQTIEEFLGQHRNKFKNENKQDFDETIPGEKPEIGHIHLVTQAINEIGDVFSKIGFTRVRYPEVDWDWYAFEALNFPENHPARDDWETFFVDAKTNEKYGPMILTPHTSNGQVREMERVKNPPIRMINIAKCYRRQLDSRHLTMFHQFEGLVVDENITLVNLKGTLDYFAKTFFGENRKTRLRPYNFQFTEPSFEVDITCGVCNGKGCKLCKEGWLELGGAGMVHPNVLKAGGIDPKKYTGFAFGWGVERTFMMKAGINLDDIRLLYSADLRFLKQF
ncbi:phenylalanine--tRNA ligase subunit alpha [soil metagenome]